MESIARPEVPRFLPRLGRSLTGLSIIGGAFVVNAVLATLVTGASGDSLLRLPGLLLGMALVNTTLYLAAFRALTPSVVSTRALIPGAAVAAIGFTFLITLGSGLVQHQLRNSSRTYGQFGTVIGLVTFLVLLATISLYGAQLNPVLSQKLWPRPLPGGRPTEADDHVMQDAAHQTFSRRQRCVEAFDLTRPHRDDDHVLLDSPPDGAPSIRSVGEVAHG